MAETGRREVVGDPLALNPTAQMADRSLATIGVRNPGKSGGQDEIYAQQMGLVAAMGNLGQAVNKVIEEKADDWRTEGRLAYMRGATEEEIAKTGNRYTKQGWHMLAAMDAANNWYANEQTQLQNGGYQLSSDEYQQRLVEQRKAHLANLPDDPAIRKVYEAAFSDLGPRLSAAHTEAHNGYNTQQTEQNFMNALGSGSMQNADASRADPNSPLMLSPGKVRTTVAYTEQDVDVLTRTILGEAAGEGPTGQAAVAHVILNRAQDGGYGGSSITGVAKAPAQFSAWNTGAGGNSPGRFSQSSKGYQNARQIALSVLSGQHVDPTNGATHYYSPRGMDHLVRTGAQANRTPAWVNEQRAKSGGEITIGGHIFMGKAKGSGPVTFGRDTGAQGGGVLKFNNKGQEALESNFAGMLTDVSTSLGRDLTITSGYRSPEHNAKVGGAGASRHTHGDAADIDMKGMSDSERAELVQTLRARGVLRFGTYDNHPDMLHVDMGTAGGNGGNWFMHNKSNANMGKAPKWFQAVQSSPVPAFDPRVAQGAGANGQAPGEVDASGYSPVQTAEAAGLATDQTYSGPQTQVQELIRGYSMPNARKGELLAQSMVTQLQTGSEQLFRDAGGVALLHELGAPQALIRQVQAAKDSYDKEQLNKFNVENVKWEADLVAEVQQGSLTRDEALAQINGRLQNQGMTDQQAQSLASQVVREAQNRGKEINMSYEVMKQVTDLWTAVNAGTTDPEQADQVLREIASANDLPLNQLNGFLTRMWSEKDSGDARRQAAIDKAAAEHTQQEQRKDMVRNAISNGSGLSSLSGIGTINRPDPAAGTVRAYSPVQWGIQEIKAREAEVARQSAEEAVKNNQGMSQEEALAAAVSASNRRIYKNLRQQGVVDDQLKGQMLAATSGNIIQKDGTIDPDAIDAFDFYMQMANDPDIGPAYMRQYFPDPQGLELIENAYMMYTDGDNFNMEQALRKSYENMDPNKWTPTTKINQDVRFNTVVADVLTEQINKVTGADNYWFAASTNISPAERQSAVENDGALRAAIERRARALHAQNPMSRAEVLIKRAAEDTMQSTYIIGGEFVLPQTATGRTIGEWMGLKNQPKDLPNQLISEQVFNHWIAERKLRNETGADVSGWGSQELGLFNYGSEAYNRAEQQAALASGMDYNEFKRNNPQAVVPFHAEYLPESGQVRVRLWKDADRTEFADVTPMLLDLSEVGANYLEREALMDEDNQPNIFQRFMNWATE